MVAEGGEGENPLPFSLTAPKRGGGGRGGGGRGGIPASFPSRSPPPKQPFQPTPTPSPGGLRKNRKVVGKRPSRLRSSISAAGPGPKPLGTWPTSPSPASPSRIPKMPRCSSAHEKPGLLHRLISCAQSLQPSLTFLLRRNNKVQGARS